MNAMNAMSTSSATNTTSPVTAGDAIDPRPLYARAAGQIAALLETVRPEQLTAPTPCTEFDVRTLLSHIVGGTRRIAVIGEGGDGLAVRPFVDGVGDDGWPAAYDDERTRILAAWADDDRLDAPVRMPWGEGPGRNALTGYVMEAVTHTWDLSEALGHPLELDPEPAEFALTVARGLLPEEQRGDDVPFASAVPAPEGVDAHGRLAAYLGRRPLS